MRFVFRRLTADDAHQIASWTYPPPYDLYDGDGAVGLMLDVPDDGTGYFAIVDAGEGLAGFCCFGLDARVGGQVEEAGTLDVGCGVRPDLVSRGIATSFVPEVVAFARETWSPLRLRAAVASFNDRSLRLCRRAGFVERRTIDGPDGRPFTELVLDLGTSTG